MYTCGVQTNKTLWCWGDNQHGGLGNGTQNNGTAPVEVVGMDWVSVATGGWHTCGIKADHSLWCWGWNADGELGNGTTQDSASPVQIGGSTWASVAAGAGIDGEHTCAVKLDGSLWCWGANALGQLGVGSTTSSATPVQVGSATWTNVSGGAAHTCGVQGDGTLWCWGDLSLCKYRGRRGPKSRLALATHAARGRMAACGAGATMTAARSATEQTRRR